jgi:SOS-response transcriptional repressor LexA
MFRGMKSKFPNGLSDAMEADQIGPTKLGRLAGFTKQDISRWAKGERRLTAEAAAALAKHLSASASDLLLVADDDAETSVVSAPVISWVQAGAPEGIILSEMRDAPHVKADNLDSNGDWIALRVEGDSMDRISPPESVIFVNLKDQRLVPNGCYIVADEQGDATYKRFRPDPERFEPVSINPMHQPIFPREGETLRVVGRVRKTVLDM